MAASRLHLPQTGTGTSILITMPLLSSYHFGCGYAMFLIFSSPKSVSHQLWSEVVAEFPPRGWGGKLRLAVPACQLGVHAVVHH